MDLIEREKKRVKRERKGSSEDKDAARINMQRGCSFCVIVMIIQSSNMSIYSGLTDTILVTSITSTACVM